MTVKNILKNFFAFGLIKNIGYLCSVILNYYTMILINNISYKYRKQTKEVFSNISFNLEQGKIYGLLGRNGVGKTTLLYNILGLQRPTTGNITFEGSQVHQSPKLGAKFIRVKPAISTRGIVIGSDATAIEAHQRNAEILQECFAVTEVVELPNYSLKKFIDIHAPFYPRFSEEELYQYLSTFNLTREIKDLTQLSMGEQKKVYISFALACNTKLLIMDEPTNGLDIPAKGEFRKNISLAMNANRCIVISTHQVADIENILDDVIIMNNNGILVNDSLLHIGENLLFSENQANAIFTQPSPGGVYTISANNNKQESIVRLELLFNALHSDKQNDILSLITNNTNK